MSPNTIKIGTMQLSAAIETALLARFLGQIRLDFLQQLVAVGPPDGSGTKSLRSYFSHLEIESKTRGANSPGVNIYLPGLITEAGRDLFGLAFKVGTGQVVEQKITLGSEQILPTLGQMTL